jgi:hypothetical protein
MFFPPGTTSRLAGGELVFMNAQPFPLTSEKGMGRYVVFKNANVRQRSMSEKIIQKMLTEEGIKPLPLGSISLPTPRTNTPLKDGFLTIAHNKFFALCHNFGLSLDTTANLWRAIVLSPILLLALIGVGFGAALVQTADHTSSFCAPMPVQQFAGGVDILFPSLSTELWSVFYQPSWQYMKFQLIETNAVEGGSTVGRFRVSRSMVTRRTRRPMIRTATGKTISSA